MKSYKNQIVSAFVIFSSMMQAPLLAQAQVIQDLPNLEAGQTPAQSDFVSSFEIKNISQKANGTFYVLDLKKPLSLSRIDLKVAKSRVRLYAVMLVTDNNARVTVKNLSDTDVARGATVSSETLNQSDRVSSIEILAESAEAMADISVLVVADREKAELNLREAKPPKAPVAPVAPAVPETPKAPAAPQAPAVPKAPVVETPKAKNPKAQPPIVEAPKAEKPKTEKPKIEKAPSSDRKVTNANRLSKGTLVIVVERSYDYAKVVSQESDGSYTVRFETGQMKGKAGGGWAREDLALASGCTRDFCVEDEIYNTEKNMARVRVIGVESKGTHVLMFLDGPLEGKVGNEWTAKNLTTLKKCGKDFCVGDSAYLYGKDREPALVRIIAIQQGGERYAVLFAEGSLEGKRGNNWELSDLAKTKGCGTKYCVGDSLINISRSNNHVKVVGIQKDGKYMLRFESGESAGKIGYNWDDSDLRKRK